MEGGGGGGDGDFVADLADFEPGFDAGYVVDGDVDAGAGEGAEAGGGDDHVVGAGREADGVIPALLIGLDFANGGGGGVGE